LLKLIDLHSMLSTDASPGMHDMTLALPAYS